MATPMRFTEAMEGSWHPIGPGPAPGDGVPGGPLGFEVAVELPEPVRPLGTVHGTLVGTVHARGLAVRAPATGTIEISPLEHRRVRYVLDFVGDDGTPFRFDGWKSIRWRRVASTWTTLPGTITVAGGAAAGTAIGTATVWFAWRDAPSLVASVRLGPPRRQPGPAALAARRWDGRPGRLEVWYDTFTDPATGAGFWLHHEVVAPDDPGQPVQAHGWAAAFPPDGPPVWERFGPGAPGEGPGFEAGGVVSGETARTGEAGEITWDLEVAGGGPPLWTFPAATWRREVLPGAQIVPRPAARYRGTVTVGDHPYRLDGVPGATARIYGHGNAERWGWLHADLGDGDVLEIVAATPRRPGLDRLPPLPMVRLRLGGRDWPSSPWSALAFHARLGLPTWTVSGRWGRRRLQVTVTQPADRCVRVGYRDPDGATATCTNTERARARVLVERRTPTAWAVEGEWDLDGKAHAEIGSRP